jgi:hypothetical protein
MKIIISPYPKKLRERSTPHPKQYPFWKELVKSLEAFDIIQIGVEGEERLVENCKFNLPTKELIELTKDMDLFISVENFFPHFCNYNFKDKKGIVLFGRSDPDIFGYQQNSNLLVDRKFLRWDMMGPWEACEYQEEAFVKPEIVVETVKKLINEKGN